MLCVVSRWVWDTLHGYIHKDFIPFTTTRREQELGGCLVNWIRRRLLKPLAYISKSTDTKVNYNIFPVFVTWADLHLNERKFLICVYSSSLFSLASSKDGPPISFHKYAGCAPTDSCQVRWNPHQRRNKRVLTLKHVHMPRGWVTECRVAMWY